MRRATRERACLVRSPTTDRCAPLGRRAAPHRSARVTRVAGGAEGVTGLQLAGGSTLPFDHVVTAEGKLGLLADQQRRAGFSPPTTVEADHTAGPGEARPHAQGERVLTGPVAAGQPVSDRYGAGRQCNGTHQDGIGHLRVDVFDVVTAGGHG